MATKTESVLFSLFLTAHGIVVVKDLQCFEMPEPWRRNLIVFQTERLAGLALRSLDQHHLRKWD
jgi:hypothetical protein